MSRDDFGGPLRKLGVVLLLSVLSAAGVLGCAANPASPSVVEDKLRVLGLSPSPPQPAPGQSVTLDLLWTDPEPSCSREESCPEGRTCVAGRCVRDDETVQIVWVVSSLFAWQETDTTISELDTGGLPLGLPGGEGETCDNDMLWSLCSLACAGGLDGISICCGDAAASRFSFDAPLVEVESPTCNDETSIDTSQVLQVQAQICVGGQLDLCNPDTSSLSFGCEGVGAQTVTTLTRVQLAHDADEANRAPVIEDPRWGELEWTEGTVIEVQGCQGADCASRGCRSQDDCATGQVCEENRCREELSLAMDSGALETYLRPCDEERSCDVDGDCPNSFVCDGGTCRRIEKPVAAFFATDGAFTPGRSVLDTTGDGRPNEERFATRWLPPTLESCSAQDDPCSFGRCDPFYNLCVGDVSVWVVARDGRGGQSWIERVVRIIP